jgi:hypothetical protein
MSSKFATVFEAIGHYLKELFGDQSEESKVNAGLAVVTPIVTALVELLGGPGASAAVTAGLAQLKSDYATLCAVVQGATPLPGDGGASFVNALAASLEDNLNAILADVGVKNSQSFGKANGYATFFLSEVKAIASDFVSTTPALPQPVVPPPPAPAPAPTAPPVSVLPAAPVTPSTASEPASESTPASPQSAASPAIIHAAQKMI